MDVYSKAIKETCVSLLVQCRRYKRSLLILFVIIGVSLSWGMYMMFSNDEETLQREFQLPLEEVHTSHDPKAPSFRQIYDISASLRGHPWVEVLTSNEESLMSTNNSAHINTYRDINDENYNDNNYNDSNDNSYNDYNTSSLGLVKEHERGRSLSTKRTGKETGTNKKRKGTSTNDKRKGASKNGAIHDASWHRDKKGTPMNENNADIKGTSATIRVMGIIDGPEPYVIMAYSNETKALSKGSRWKHVQILDIESSRVYIDEGGSSRWIGLE